MERGLMLDLAFSPRPTRHNTIVGSILSTQDENQPAPSQLAVRWVIKFLFVYNLTNVVADSA